MRQLSGLKKEKKRIVKQTRVQIFKINEIKGNYEEGVDAYNNFITGDI